MKAYSKENIPLARELRRNMTEQERRLWYGYLRKHTPRFQRQKAIGGYIVDFYCAAAHLVLELDGSQHYETAQQEKDAERTSFLESCGLRVVRIPNNAVNENFRGVCEHIDELVKNYPTTADAVPLP
ncbi:MAG: endonuclease domain-containing protein, partial [Oscillospiraceae bacterium]|nr:endonuclease domain-containing protein [Oscillospiraceae bacterium]